MTPQEASAWFNNARELTKNKQYRTTLSDLCLQTSFLGDTASTPQRLWHIINSTNVIPGCKTCGHEVSWDHRYKNYKTFCGNPRCANLDPDVIHRKKTNSDYEKQLRKRQETNLRKYGHTNFLASPEGSQKLALYHQNNKRTRAENQHRSAKRQQTMLDRYGVKNFSHTRLTPETHTLLSDKQWLHNAHYVQHTTLTRIAEQLNVSSGATTIGKYLHQHGLETQTPPARSTPERDMCQWLEGLGVSIKVGSRNIIAPYELDIYLPDHNIAIEYCGLYWHSEQQGKDRYYHQRKYKMCAERGIQLLTIFEDEWTGCQPHVKQKILSLLGMDQRPVVYARSCCIEVINTQQRDEFFIRTHIQGTGPGSVSYGLTHSGEIVAVMSWIKQSNNQWILNRYATSKRVIGGFSKLLKHFQQTHNWCTLVSFADLRWSTGHLYKTTGWKIDTVIPPDYYYSPDGHKRIHKFNYRRKNLPKLLETFDPTLSEVENCKANGVLRIWDCGKIRFVISRPTQ